MELPKKIRKPLVEKKRRARINDSLELLKEILLHNTALAASGGGAAVANASRPAKLEKADILEMTIRYIRTLQQQRRPMTTTTTPTPVNGLMYDVNDEKRKRHILSELTNIRATHVDTEQQKQQPEQNQHQHQHRQHRKYELQEPMGMENAESPWRPW